MSVLPRIEALATGTDRLTMYREGIPQPARIDLTKVVGGISDRHVEIIRDDLSEVYYDAGATTSSTSSATRSRNLPDGDVTSTRGTTQVRRGNRRRRAALERPALGLRRGRRPTDPRRVSRRCCSAPKRLRPKRRWSCMPARPPGGDLRASQLDDARAFFMFRSKEELRTTTEIPCGRRNYCASDNGRRDRWIAG